MIAPDSKTNKVFSDESGPASSHPSYVYIARLKTGGSSGIRSKVTNTVNAIGRQGRDVRLDIVSSGGIRSVFKFIQAAAAANEDVLLVRSDHYSMLLMAPVLLFKRLTGKMIILDVPNPVRVSYRETWARKEPLPKRVFMLLILLLSYPLAFLPVHRIQEYGIEGWFASFGMRHKIVLVGNAANIQEISYMDHKPIRNGRSIVFGLAGHIAYFHGVDRFLRSMAHYNQSCGDYDIQLKIIGGGFEIDALKTLTKDLGLAVNVEFLDPVPLRALEGFFETVNIGLCNLAQYRKGIFLNSDLKSRDMAARGLPFILAIEDPD
jgi:glycosyltransferase involved in cell wall biosynthesis